MPEGRSHDNTYKTIYDKYIDRRKLTENKNPFEHIVPPLSRVGTKNCHRFETILQKIDCAKIIVVREQDVIGNELFSMVCKME